MAQLKIKLTKSRSLSIRKRIRNDTITFLVNVKKIPLLVEHPVQSLGRLYTADLSDKHTVATVASQLVENLTKINQNYPPGKFKVWCYQHTLHQQVMWLLKLNDIRASMVPRMNAKANNFIRKWLGLPQCLSNIV